MDDSNLGGKMDSNCERICDECGSSFLQASSQMSSLCPECASVLYGYPTCEHIFVDGRCIKCHWDGSQSEYIKNLKEQSNL